MLRLAAVVLAAVVAIAAWVGGPSRSAIRIRAVWTGGLGRSTGDEAGPVAAFVARSKTGLRIAGAGVALAVLILWNHPKPITVLAVGILFIVFLAIIELLGRGAPAPAGTGSA